MLVRLDIPRVLRVGGEGGEGAEGEVRVDEDDFRANSCSCVNVCFG